MSYSQDFKSVARTAGLHVLPSHSSWNLQREWNVMHRLTHAHQKTHNEINLFDSLHLHQKKADSMLYRGAARLVTFGFNYEQSCGQYNNCT